MAVHILNVDNLKPAQTPHKKVALEFVELYGQYCTRQAQDFSRHATVVVAVIFVCLSVCLSV